MINIHKTIASIGAFIILAAFSLMVLSGQQAQAGIADPVCESASTASVVVGNQASTLIVSTSTDARAYVRISQPNAATNTIAVSFNQGALATFSTGEIMDNATGTRSSLPAFGINTPFPYRGAVTAISNNGSTSVIVTTCTY